MSELKIASGWDVTMCQNAEARGGAFGIGDHLCWTHWPPGAESYEAHAASLNALFTNVARELAGSGAKRVLINADFDPTFIAWVEAQGHMVTLRNSSNQTEHISPDDFDVFMEQGLSYLSFGGDVITPANAELFEFCSTGGTLILLTDANSYPSYTQPFWTLCGIAQSGSGGNFNNTVISPYDVVGVPFFDGVTDIRSGTCATFALGTPTSGTRSRWQATDGVTPKYVFAGWRP